MEIVDIKQEYLTEISRIEQENFSEPYSEKSLFEMILNEHYSFLVAYENEVLGYVGINFVLDECDITHIVVKNSQKGKKIATKLMEKLTLHCKSNQICKIHLEVRESNEKALGLYRKFGFLEVGKRKNYYKNPSENAILMTLEV